MANSSNQLSHPLRSEPTSKPAGLHLNNWLRLSHDRGPPNWSVYELTDRGAELEAGGRVEKHSNGMPRICWHTILTCANPQWYGKPLKQRRLLSRQGEHSSRYWPRGVRRGSR